MDDLLSRYRKRSLDLNTGYKPLDFGGVYSPITGSINSDGRIIAINTFHPKHGYITLTSAPPFSEADRYNPDAVRAYRHSLTELDGFGLRFKSPIASYEAWLIEDAIPYIKLQLENGVEAHVITFVPVRNQNGVMQIWWFSEVGKHARMEGKLWLQRSAYTQLTEGGPVEMPSVVTKPFYDDEKDVFFLANDDLSCYAVFNYQEAQQAADGGVNLIRQTATLPEVSTSTNYTVFPFVLGLDQEPAIQAYQALRSADARQLLTETLDKWQAHWQDWQFERHPLDAVMKRALVYGIYCSVPVTDDAVCIITDHMLLPLSWNRDAYYVARSLMLWRDDMGDLVRKHLYWMFKVAEKTADGAWGRAYFTNGKIKDPAFQLDQQIFPLLELARYIEDAGDKSILDEFAGEIKNAIDMILSRKHPEHWLFPTDETPADDPMVYDYHFSSHVLLWFMFIKLAQFDSSRDYDTFADEIRAAIDRHFIAGREGKQIYTYATDGIGNHHFYHDANDVPLVLMPQWGAISATDTIWRNTIDFAFSQDNIDGVYDGILGSVHTQAPWALGDGQEIIVARALDDKNREQVVQRRLASAAQWDGALSEAYADKSYRVVSRNWFAWPNALLANIYLGEAQQTSPES